MRLFEIECGAQYSDGHDNVAPTKRKTKPTKPKSNEPTLLAVPDAFDELWEIYKPTPGSEKGSMTAARKNWKALSILPVSERPSPANILQAVKNYLKFKHSKTEFNTTHKLSNFLSPSSRPYEEYLPANYHPEQQQAKPLPVNITPTGGTNNVSRFAARVRQSGDG
jgi:hypothetical protein